MFTVQFVWQNSLNNVRDQILSKTKTTLGYTATTHCCEVWLNLSLLGIRFFEQCIEACRRETWIHSGIFFFSYEKKDSWAEVKRQKGIRRISSSSLL